MREREREREKREREVGEKKKTNNNHENMFVRVCVYIYRCMRMCGNEHAHKYTQKIHTCVYIRYLGIHRTHVTANNSTTNNIVFFYLVDWLFGFYGISFFAGYLTPNPFV